MHAPHAKILFFTSKYGFLSSIILFLKVTGWQLCTTLNYTTYYTLVSDTTYTLIHCFLHFTLYTLHTAYYVLQSTLYILHTMHHIILHTYTLHTIYYTLYTAHNASPTCTIRYTQHSTHCTLQTTQLPTTASLVCT